MFQKNSTSFKYMITRMSLCIKRYTPINIKKNLILFKTVNRELYHVLVNYTMLYYAVYHLQSLLIHYVH